MESGSKPASTQSVSPAREEAVTTKETYNGSEFHLHQVVSFPNRHDRDRELVVIGLDDGLTLASPDFSWKTEFDPGEVPSQITPRFAETGIPVFGY